MLYNEARPKTFREIVGQKNVQILRNQARLHYFSHSYLFAGDSGTGKTTTARVLAMAMNCQNDGTGEPCGQCPNCQAISKGNHWDVIEIDATRQRGIDDIKEICRRAQLYPMSGQRKVYIMDECHALTEEAWNAMLKLLEEPPEYLTIILCTTQKHRIPDTVISRCHTIAFNRITATNIIDRLKAIAKRKHYTPSEYRLKWIAQHACGNMREAETMLEQALLMNG